MKKTIAALFLAVVRAARRRGLRELAFRRGEPINSAYLVIAAVCTYAIGYRFYSKWIAARVLALDDRRATPCVVHDDGRDFVKTNKLIVFGHHFAAIAGPGPLVGPVLAAQFGYLPGTLVDFDRRRARRRGAGFCHSVLLRSGVTANRSRKWSRRN